MNEEDRLTDWEQAVEYGKHIFGVYPNGGEQKVTGVIAHDGDYFTSYVETGQWNRYPNWVREYKETPLKNALEAFVEDRGKFTTECAINNDYYPTRRLESAGLSGWRFEYERKQAFKRNVLRGNIELNTISLFNRYGNIYTVPDRAEEVRDRYWEFVDENYDYRHSHQAATKTQSD